MRALDELGIPRNDSWSRLSLGEERAGKRSNVLVFESVRPIERLMVATDVGITKANRGTNIDLMALETPAIALSQELNLNDDQILRALGARLLLVRGVDPHQLREAIVEQAGTEPSRPALSNDGAHNCAVELSATLIG